MLRHYSGGSAANLVERNLFGSLEVNGDTLNLGGRWRGVDDDDGLRSLAAGLAAPDVPYILVFVGVGKILECDGAGCVVNFEIGRAGFLCYPAIVFGGVITSRRLVIVDLVVVVVHQDVLGLVVCAVVDLGNESDVVPNVLIFSGLVVGATLRIARDVVADSETVVVDIDGNFVVALMGRQFVFYVGDFHSPRYRNITHERHVGDSVGGNGIVVLERSTRGIGGPSLSNVLDAGIVGGFDIYLAAAVGRIFGANFVCIDGTVFVGQEDLAACRTYAGGASEDVELVVRNIPSERLHIVGETVDGGVFLRVSTVEGGRRATLVDGPRTRIAGGQCRVKGVMVVAYINTVVFVGVVGIYGERVVGDVYVVAALAPDYFVLHIVGVLIERVFGGVPLEGVCGRLRKTGNFGGYEVAIFYSDCVSVDGFV